MSKNDLLIPSFSDADLDEFPMGKLIELVNQCRLMTASLVRLCARVVASAERRGEDVGQFGLSPTVLHNLRLVSCGSLLPEAFARFEGTAVLNRVRALPTTDQQRLSGEDCGVDVFEYQNGEPTHRRIPPLELSRLQTQQVFGTDGIRSLPQQRTWLDERNSRTAQRSVEHPLDGVDYNRRRDEFVFHGPVSRKLLMQVLASTGR